ncbi:MAG: nicotinamide riboside transporter PnuC [Gammaproteobacteria bacterium]|nr:nicotinamide riboside transporter PnuC [Gammaproteobacteria bacterium]
MEALSLLSHQAAATPFWETIAVILAIVYLLLVVRENIACWYAAFVSTLIFLVIFWHVNLYMESALQIYYLIMAVYGWYQWRQPASGTHYLPISTWRWYQHVLAITIVLGASTLSGYLLATHTDARLPWLDSFTTWASVLTTWMVARKILENWIYWLVIDSLSIYLYFDRALYFTALLFAVYLIIIGFGLHRWIKTYQNQSISD